MLAAAAPVTVLGRWAARRLSQPQIIGEIMACLLLGGVLASWADWQTGSPGWQAVKFLGHLGLALFLAGAAHGIRHGTDRIRGRAVAWLSAGSALLPLACGALFAAWVVAYGGTSLRGEAPVAALGLMLAIALAVTAVPVLAGVLADRGMEHTPTGRLAMASAVSIDAVIWLLLAVAIGLGAESGGIGQAAAVLICGLLAAVAVRRLASTTTGLRFASRHPALALALVGVAAVAAAQTTERLGLTDTIGAVLVGLAVPAGRSQPAWTKAAEGVGRIGRPMLPALFTLTGTTVAGSPQSGFSWQATAIATTLAIASKLTGSYLGARIGEQSPLISLQLAALMNCRGLTEIVVLQTGYSAGILTPGLYLALLAMALVTTALTGPLLWAIDHYTRVPEMRLTSPPHPAEG
nr:cation:proton antiporter [Streptomyces endocoffeicus]